MTPSAFRSASAVLRASRCTPRSATPRYSSPNELFQVWAASTTTRYFVIRSAFQARSKNAAVSPDYGRGTLYQVASGLEFREKYFLLSLVRKSHVFVPSELGDLAPPFSGHANRKLSVRIQHKFVRQIPHRKCKARSE